MRQKLSPRENRRAWLVAGLIVLVLLASAALALLARDRGWFAPAASLPAEQSVTLQAAEGLDHITVDAVFDPENRLLTGTQVMTLRNPAAHALDEIVLRSYSGAFLTEESSPSATDELFTASYGGRFSPGGLTFRQVQINGVDAAWTLSKDSTVLTLTHAWPTGAEVTLRLTWQILVPECAGRFGVRSGIFALGNVFPSLALYEDGAWRTDPYIAIGDPFLTACANWDVRLTVPQGYAVAATGYAPPVPAGDQAVYTMQALAVRDFSLVISDRFTASAAMEDDVLVTAFAADEEAARSMVKFARQALRCYKAHYGPYVYPSLTLAEVDFPHGGMEYPRMVMIGSSAIAARDDSLEIVVAHEVAHQWWYAMVGSDSWYQAWQDESLCEYALMDYIGQVYGPNARAGTAFDRIETALRITVPRGVTPGSPISYFQDLSEYSLVVYQRGAALWMALETHMGKEQLDAALRAYREKHLFGMASRDDLTSILSQSAGHDLTALLTDYLDTYITN